MICELVPSTSYRYGKSTLYVYMCKYAHHYGYYVWSHVVIVTYVERSRESWIATRARSERDFLRHFARIVLFMTTFSACCGLIVRTTCGACMETRTPTGARARTHSARYILQHAYTHTHTHTHTHTPARARTCVHEWTHIYTYTDIQTDRHTEMPTYRHVRIIIM